MLVIRIFDRHKLREKEEETNLDRVESKDHVRRRAKSEHSDGLVDLQMMESGLAELDKLEAAVHTRRIHIRLVEPSQPIVFPHSLD